MLAVGFALFSCAKPDEQVGLSGEDSQGENLDQITAYSPSTPSKTVLNNETKVFWTDGDQIGMYAANAATSNFKAVLEEPSASAVFGRTTDTKPKKINTRYYAVYPLSAIAKWSSEADMKVATKPFCSVIVPKVQTAVVGSWDPSAAILAAKSASNAISFKHAVAYLRFEVTEQTEPFVSVRLTANNGEKLSDTEAGILYQTTGVTLAPSNLATNFVTLNNAVKDAPFETGVYYMAFIPGDFTSGLTLTFTNAEGLTSVKKVAAITLNAGNVADFGVIQGQSYSEPLPPLEKYSVFEENGKKQGVVYYVDPDNPYKGKIVSVSTTERTPWSDGTIWTDKIISQEDGLANYNQFNASAVYTDNKDKFYALKYCEDMRSSLGGNWYLPAPREIDALFASYYGLNINDATNTETYVTLSSGAEYRIDSGALNEGVMSVKAQFDAALSALGETTTATLDGDANADGISDNKGYGDTDGVTYWSSKVNTGGAIQYTNIGVYILNNTSKANKDCYVRCIRDVEIDE